MSGSPPAVSEACADEEGGGHTPYQAAAAHQAAPAAHTSYLFCEEPKKSGIMILLHTIGLSLWTTMLLVSKVLVCPVLTEI